MIKNSQGYASTTRLCGGRETRNCFHLELRNASLSASCDAKCLPDCEEVKFRVKADTVVMDAEVGVHTI